MPEKIQSQKGDSQPTLHQDVIPTRKNKKIKTLDPKMIKN